MDEKTEDEGWERARLAFQNVAGMAIGEGIPADAVVTALAETAALIAITGLDEGSFAKILHEGFKMFQNHDPKGVN